MESERMRVRFAAKIEEKIAGYLIIYYVLDEGEYQDCNSSFYVQKRGCRQMFQETCGVL